MSKRKYEKGKRIDSISEFSFCESQWYIWREKTTHRSILTSLQYHTLEQFIKHGMIWVAKKIEDSVGSEYFCADGVRKEC